MQFLFEEQSDELILHQMFSLLFKKHNQVQSHSDMLTPSLVKFCFVLCHSFSYTLIYWLYYQLILKNLKSPNLLPENSNFAYIKLPLSFHLLHMPL